MNMRPVIAREFDERGAFRAEEIIDVFHCKQWKGVGRLSRALRESFREERELQ